MIKSAAELLAAGAPRTEVVTVRGMEVKVRELSVGHRRRMLEASKADPMSVPPLLVELCAVDEDCRPLFSAEDAKALQDTAPEIVDTIAAAVMRVSGLAEKPGND